jgi:hypothetical protein
VSSSQNPRHNSELIDLNSFEEWRGYFEAGWTPNTIEATLPLLSERLGVELVCLWEGHNGAAFIGDSQIVVEDQFKKERVYRSLPDALWGFLLEGDEEEKIDKRTLTSGQIVCRDVDLSPDSRYPSNVIYKPPSP